MRPLKNKSRLRGAGSPGQMSMSQMSMIEFIIVLFIRIYSSNPGWVLTSIGVVPGGPRPLGGGGALVSGPVAVVLSVLSKAAERRVGLVEVTGGEDG